MRILLLLCVVLLSACSVEKRAQRHLHRAIKLDPTIIKMVSKDTVVHIDTVVDYHDTLYRERDSVVSTNQLDSLVKELKKGNEVLLAENKNLNLRMKLTDGKLQTIANLKPDTIYRTIKVPVEIEKKITVPGKEVIVKKRAKGFWYYSGMAFWGLVVISIGFYIIKKNINPFS